MVDIRSSFAIGTNAGLMIAMKTKVRTWMSERCLVKQSNTSIHGPKSNEKRDLNKDKNLTQFLMNCDMGQTGSILLV
jgi:hypothetical protein